MCGFLAVMTDDPGILKVAPMAARYLRHRGLPGDDYTGQIYDFDNGLYFYHSSLPMVTREYDEYHQPRVYRHQSGTVVPLVFAGEIFNWKEIFMLMDGGLINPDHKSDIDLMVHSLSGTFSSFSNMAHMFDGFWSFATVDPGGHLVAGTDYLAQKPVYYRTDINAVASEPGPLLLLGPVTENQTFRSNTLKWGYDMTGATAWNEVRQLPPGHLYIQGSVHRYWHWSKVVDPVFKEIGDASLPDDPLGVLKTYLITSVRRRMRACRDVGLLLSGGLDSTLILGAMDHIRRKDKIPMDVKCYHVDNDESSYAQMAFNQYIDEDDETVQFGLLESLDTEDLPPGVEAIMTHQSPVDLGSVRPQIALAKALESDGLNCVMSGDGADELFGGYRRAMEYDSQKSDVFYELPYYHNPRLDRCMMRYTVELRAPFMAPYIVSLALKLPYEERKGKKILKDLALDFGVPDEIIQRAKQPLKTSEIRKSLQDNTRRNWETFDFAGFADGLYVQSMGRRIYAS